MSEDKDETTGRFLPGNNASIGRPKGSRNKLNERFFDDLYGDWKTYGAAVIAQVREKEPGTYLKIAASVLPKEVVVNNETMGDMSDGELMDILATIRSISSVRPGPNDIN